MEVTVCKAGSWEAVHRSDAAADILAGPRHARGQLLTEQFFPEHKYTAVAYYFNTEYDNIIAPSSARGCVSAMLNC